MPKMYIPEIGDKITLTKDWTFRLFSEGRNSTLAALLGVTKFDHGRHILRADGKKFFWTRHPSGEYKAELGGYCAFYAADGERFDLPPKGLYAIQEGKVAGVSYEADAGAPITLKAGQVLSVDRVYIRRGASDFSSITFNYIGAPKGSGRVRFWAKLADVNTIEFE